MVLLVLYYIFDSVLGVQIMRAEEVFTRQDSDVFFSFYSRMHAWPLIKYVNICLYIMNEAKL